MLLAFWNKTTANNFLFILCQGYC